MDGAEAKYDALVKEARTYTAIGREVPVDVRAKGLEAANDRLDALAKYASTPQGAADLAARMDALTVDGKAPAWQNGNQGSENYHDYAEALSDGARMRARAKDIHDAVKAGTMTGEEAAALTQAQTVRDGQWRQHGARTTEPAAPAPQSPSATVLLAARKTALKNATAATIASTAKEVKAAVNLIAATVRAKYPNAKRVELEGSDQGDWLNVVSIDGDADKVDALESGDNSDADDLSWAASCIYVAHRSASPALHPVKPQHLLARADLLYIDIDEALA